MTRSSVVHRFFTSLVALWCVLLLAPALLAEEPSTIHLAHTLYQFFSLICHQIDARSFHVGGHKLAVCIRCSSIYGSFFLSTILLQLLHPGRLTVPSRALLFSASLPMLMDVVLSVFNIIPSSTTSRIITGFLFGGALPLYIVPSLEEAVEQLRNRFPFSGGSFYARETK